MTEAVRFLLVEDAEPDAWLLARGVERLRGARVWVVPDGAEAVAYLQGWGEYADRQRFPLPHIILLDWKMPRMSGLQFLKWRREKAPADVAVIPVVVLSGSEDPESVREAHVWGAACFMTKTGDTGVLRKRLELLMALWREAELPTVVAA